MTTYEIDGQYLKNNPLPLPQGETDKDSRGRVIVVGGHREVPGGVLLAGVSALRAGAGKVQIATVESAAMGLAMALPEARVTGLPETESGDIAADNGARIEAMIQDEDAVLIGPGMLDDNHAGSLAATLLKTLDRVSIVLDAAALTGLRRDTDLVQRRAGHLVMTPHAGEMATFLGIHRDEVIADPLGAAHRAAALTGSVVVMKGSCTHIVDAQGQASVCRHGNVGLATSGSGDTLAGIIVGLMARGAPPLLAAQWGVFIHAEAGERLRKRLGLLGYLAREIPAEIPGIMEGLPPG